MTTSDRTQIKERIRARERERLIEQAYEYCGESEAA